MKESELETMRKSFKTVKDRSSKIKNCLPLKDWKKESGKLKRSQLPIRRN